MNLPSLRKTVAAVIWAVPVVILAALGASISIILVRTALTASPPDSLGFLAGGVQTQTLLLALAAALVWVYSTTGTVLFGEEAVEQGGDTVEEVTGSGVDETLDNSENEGGGGA
jgi:hypothetical protein